MSFTAINEHLRGVFVIPGEWKLEPTTAMGKVGIYNNSSAALPVIPGESVTDL